MSRLDRLNGGDRWRGRSATVSAAVHEKKTRPNRLVRHTVGIVRQVVSSTAPARMGLTPGNRQDQNCATFNTTLDKTAEGSVPAVWTRTLTFTKKAGVVPQTGVRRASPISGGCCQRSADTPGAPQRCPPVPRLGSSRIVLLHSGCAHARPRTLHPGPRSDRAIETQHAEQTESRQGCCARHRVRCYPGGRLCGRALH